MKARRQATVLDIVGRDAVRSREQLRQRLVARGFDVTQATLSRDLKELRENGYSRNQILSVSTELIDLVTEDLKARTE